MEDEYKNTMHIEHTLQLHGSIPSVRCKIILQKDDDGGWQTIIKGVPIRIERNLQFYGSISSFRDEDEKEQK